LRLPELCKLLSLGDNYDQLTNVYSMAKRIVEKTKHFKIFHLLDVLCIVETAVNASDGSLKPVSYPEKTFVNLSVSLDYLGDRLYLEPRMVRTTLGTVI